MSKYAVYGRYRPSVKLALSLCSIPPSVGVIRGFVTLRGCRVARRESVILFPDGLPKPSSEPLFTFLDPFWLCFSPVLIKRVIKSYNSRKGLRVIPWFPIKTRMGQACAPDWGYCFIDTSSFVGNRSPYTYLLRSNLNHPSYVYLRMNSYELLQKAAYS